MTPADRRKATEGEPLIIKAESARSPIITSHPYAGAFTVVTAAALWVYFIEWFVGFPPLVILGAAAGVSLTLLGRGPGLLAFVLSVLISDFYFIEPLLTLTGQSFVVAAYYSWALLVSRYVTRHLTHG